MCVVVNIYLSQYKFNPINQSKNVLSDIHNVLHAYVHLYMCISAKMIDSEP